MTFVTIPVLLLLSSCITFNQAAPIPCRTCCTTSTLSTFIHGGDEFDDAKACSAPSKPRHCSQQLWQQDSQSRPNLQDAIISRIFAPHLDVPSRGDYKCRPVPAARTHPNSAFDVRQLPAPEFMYAVSPPENLQLLQNTTRRLLHLFRSIPGNLLVAGVFAILILAALLSSLLEMGWSR